MTVKTFYQAEDGQLFETYHEADEHNFIETVATSITECPTVYTASHSARALAKHLLANYNMAVKSPMQFWDEATAGTTLVTDESDESAISPRLQAILNHAD